MAVLGNLALWETLTELPDLTGSHGVFFGVAFALIIAGVLVSLLSLVAWRHTLKPVITLFLLLTGFATHYMLAYGIVVDTPMVINVFQTDTREARDQLSWQLAGTVLCLAVLPVIWLWRQPMTSPSWQQQLLRNGGLCLGGLLLSFAMLQVVYQDFASLMRNHTQLRYQINPLNSVYALLDLTVIPSDRPNGPLQPPQGRKLFRAQDFIDVNRWQPPEQAPPQDEPDAHAIAALFRKE